MNAYDLAEKIMQPDCFKEYIFDAANMLRQQADRLALLDSPPSVLIQIIDSQKAAIEFIRNNE